MNYGFVNLTESILLERIRFAAEARFSRYILESARFETYLDPMCQDIVARITVSLAGKECLPHVETRCVPRTWRDHWKLAHWNTGWMNALRWLGLVREPQLLSLVFTTSGKVLFTDLPATFLDDHAHFYVRSYRLQESFL